MKSAYRKGFLRGYDTALALVRSVQNSVAEWEQKHDGQQCPTDVIWDIVRDFPSAVRLAKFYESDLNIDEAELIEDLGGVDG